MKANKEFADLGRVDVIINNARYGLFGSAEELSDAGLIIGLSAYGGQAALPAGSLYYDDDRPGGRGRE